MTDRGMMLLRGLRMNLQLLREHDKTEPAEVDDIIAAVMSDFRAWKPQAVTRTLDTGPFARLEPDPTPVG